MGLFKRIYSAFREPAAASVPQATERRSLLDNAAVQVSPQLLDSIIGLGPTRSGIQVNEKTALTVVAVYAAHKILGETIGMLPWAVYEGDEDAKQRTRAKEHPAYMLLRRRPNPEMTPFTFRETIMHHCLGWGNGYARIVRDNADRPIELRPLQPDRIYPERKAGVLVYRYSDRETFAAEDIFHVPALSFDGIRGYSPIAMARESIGAGKAAEIYGATFFGNGANVNGMLKYPGKLKPEALNNLRESVNAMYAGTGNANKMMILEGGMEYVRTSVAPDEAQFIETKKFSIVDIARLYRVPPHMLGDTSHSRSSSIEQASLEFLIYTMSPWFAKFEQEADRKLCGDGDFYVKFDERELLRSDLAARQNYYAAGRQWGWLSANDVLRMEGEQPIGPQGDVYLSPANEQNAKVVIQQTKPANPHQAGKPGSGSEAFGGKDPTNQQNSRAIAAAAMRVVFEDAVSRMLHKEHNALSRGKADDDFYANHRSHFIEALAPAVCSLGQMMGEPLDASCLTPFAEERHADLNGNLPVVAAQKAGEIIKTLTEKP